MTTKITLAKGLNMGLRKAMEDDPKVLIMGEDVGKLGGVFRITDGLQKDFGEDRVIDSPLAESGIVGTAVGLAMRGYRPVVEIQFDGFVYPAYDQIVCQVAKIHFRSQGRLKMPIVIRIPFGGGIGAVEHHSESPEAQFAHTPGLKVVACSNPVDGYWMIQQAIAHDDPVIFLEPKRQYHADKAELDEHRRRPTRCSASRVVRRGQRRHAARLRPDGEDRDEGRRGRRRRGPVARGDRPAHAVAARHGARCSSPYAAPAARSSSTRRTSTSAWAPSWRPGSPRSASTPWRRRCSGSAASTRRTRRRGSRRTSSPTSTGSSTPSTARWTYLRSTDARVPASRRRRGPHRGRDRDLEGQGRRRGRHQRHRRRDRDRQVAGRAALAVRRRGDRAAGRRGRDDRRSAPRSSRSASRRAGDGAAGRGASAGWRSTSPTPPPAAAARASAWSAG